MDAVVVLAVQRRLHPRYGATDTDIITAASTTSAATTNTSPWPDTTTITTILPTPTTVTPTTSLQANMCSGHHCHHPYWVVASPLRKKGGRNGVRLGWRHGEGEGPDQRGWQQRRSTTAHALHDLYMTITEASAPQIGGRTHIHPL